MAGVAGEEGVAGVAGGEGMDGLAGGEGIDGLAGGEGTSGVAGREGVAGVAGRSRIATALEPGAGRGAAKTLVKVAKAARNPKVRMLMGCVVWKDFCEKNECGV
jgi:hypothetical protein